MPSEEAPQRRIRATAIAVAYRAETGVRDWLARRAVSRGWTPAIIPYVGYGSANIARVLGRVVLAPASVNPAARRGVPGWRRLLTLESPETEVEVQLGGVALTVKSDEAGVIDARLSLDSPLAAGTVKARLHVNDRDPVPANVHVVDAERVRGVICDIDDTVWITGISHPARAAWRTLRGTSASRKSVPGMGRLLRAAVEGEQDPGVVYLSNGPWNLVGPVSRFLEKHRFPGGAVLMTDWGITPTRWFRDGQKHKSSSLALLMEDLPHVTWVLVGDDGEDDPDLYSDIARTHPDRVAAIALRHIPRSTSAGKDHSAGSVNGVPILRGSDGDELLPLLRNVLQENPPTEK